MADDKQTFDPTLQDKVKAYEEILRANPVRFEEETPAEETKPPSREILFRGDVHVFNAIGPQTGAARRAGVVQRWQADVHVKEGSGFNVVVDEFRDGRFTPWSFDGIYFNDFMQAVVVGLVSGTFESNWRHEQWKHERTRQKFILFVLPAVLVTALLAGIVIGLRH
jgi:hypothetical protein